MQSKEIAVIGGGIVGSTTAFHLAQLGHNVVIIDPELNIPISNTHSTTGSKASLGILMGHSFRKSSGRGWRLRKRSMELWPEWINQLSNSETLLSLQTPFIQLARSLQEQNLMKSLSNQRANLGISVLEDSFNPLIGRAWPSYQYGGLISKQDGRIDPLQLLICLMQALDKLRVEKVNYKVTSLLRLSKAKEAKWKIILENNNTYNKDFIIICAALNSQSLLSNIGYKLPIEAVLGQAMELVLENDDRNWDEWPGVLMCNGINMIPKSKNEIILGATLERGINPNKLNLKEMQRLNGDAPEWLANAHIKNHWHGIRARPKQQAAPLLEKLEPGLIINTAHYRNGVLLAPACAEWVASQI